MSETNVITVNELGVNGEGGGGDTNLDEMSELITSELSQNMGTGYQNPETGRMGEGGMGIKGLTNKLFGAPYQLLDSVDTRFPKVNKNVGSEYLRNFLLNSPILYIKPGMPKYTGGEASGGIFNAIADARALKMSQGGQNMSNAQVAGSVIAKNFTPIGSGSKIQKRMFGFRETYLEYMHYVNYMCRSVAVLMGLPQMAENGIVPNGTFTSGDKFEPFESMRWENYRMTDEYVNTAIEQIRALTMGTGTSVGNLVSSAKSSDSGILDVMRGKITNVQFMVNPVSFQESLTNQTGQSMIEAALSGISDSIGSEIAFITNSNVDVGILGDMMKVLGDASGTAAVDLTKLMNPLTGGFASNLFSGAIGSLSGQKMIYPEIYKSSEASISYTFDITLTSPYGDPYNYYMNIVVPLMHLIGLVAPRMMTSNTVASPFLVQAFIPGMVTCELGIVKSLTITKNPKTSHVSIHGFPLTVGVTFDIQPLYRNLSISPAHDPASFMFNETLNDYLANLAGLVPSIDTFNEQRAAMYQNLGQYFSGGIMIEDKAQGWLTDIEDTVYNQH